MLGATLGVNDYLERVCQEIPRVDPAQIENLSSLIERQYETGRFVFIIGNGGSGRTPRTCVKTSPSVRSAISSRKSACACSA